MRDIGWVQTNQFMYKDTGSQIYSAKWQKHAQGVWHDVVGWLTDLSLTPRPYFGDKNRCGWFTRTLILYVTQ